MERRLLGQQYFFGYMISHIPFTKMKYLYNMWISFNNISLGNLLLLFISYNNKVPAAELPTPPPTTTTTTITTTTTTTTMTSPTTAANISVVSQK